MPLGSRLGKSLVVSVLSYRKKEVVSPVRRLVKKQDRIVLCDEAKALRERYVSRCSVDDLELITDVVLPRRVFALTFPRCRPPHDRLGVI
jgi:hypothetical protein